MTELHRSLATNLKAHRQRWGFSQADLAERSGISVGFVGDIEVAVKFPSAEVLEKLAQALHIRPYQLLLTPSDAMAFQDWLERRNRIDELGEELLAYFEKRRP